MVSPQPDDCAAATDRLECGTHRLTHPVARLLPDPSSENTPPHIPAPRGLWAITSYFNPIGYRRRLANYRLFRRHLQLPLITVELSFGDAFELADGDAEILVQLKGGDVMWQKERLLNLALRHLPPDCSAVAWIDCDVIFERPDWADAAMRKLEDVLLVQPFGEKHNLAPEWKAGDQPSASDRVLRPTARILSEGISAAVCFGDVALDVKLASGLAWVGRRELLERHGFYDACIVGGGDHAFAAALYGCGDLAAETQVMNGRRRDHYRRWADPVFDETQGRVGYVAGRVFHLWHGSRGDRAYGERHGELARFQFDPFDDIAVAASGAWQWNSPKPDLHAYIRDYLISRREDG